MFIQRGNNNLEIEIADNPAFLNTYSLDFDGVDDIVRLGTPSTVGTGGINTLSFWVKANAQSTTSISDYLFSDDGVSGYNWWRFFHGNGTDLYWRNINGVAFNLVPNLFDGNWHNVVVIRNPSALVDGSLRVYVDNGTPIDRTLDYRYGVAGFYNGGLGTIGNNSTASSGFNGIIDEVSVWNSEITPSDVASIYNSGSPTDLSLLPTPPTNWYRNGDNGAYKSPQWLIPSNENKDKVSNYSFEFDGMDDKIELGTQSLGLTGAISVSAWVKIPTTNTGGGGNNIQNIVCEDRTSGTNRNWTLYWRGGGLNQISGVIWDSAGSAVAATTTAIVPNDGIWHHVMFTYTGDTSTDGLKLFVDGDPRAQGTSANGGTNSTTAVVPTIGGLSQTIAWMFEGNIDEVSVFNSDQSANIATLYNNGTPTTLPSGAVAHYKMGEEANFTSNWLVDNSALTNYSKRSFQFDGMDDYVDTNSTKFSGASEFSISMWANFSSLSGNNPIVSNWFTGVTNYIVRYSSTKLQFYISTTGGVAKVTEYTFTPTLGIWYNIICVYNGSNISIYINGNPQGTPTAITGTVLANTNNCLIGERGTEHFSGIIDEVSYFDKALTLTEITDIYNLGTPTDLTDLSPIAWYKMGEDASFNGTNWTVPDQVGTNNGTSNAMLVDALVGEAPNYSGGGISNGMTIEDRVGEAPNSENNALSFNMESVDRTTDVPT